MHGSVGIWFLDQLLIAIGHGCRASGRVLKVLKKRKKMPLRAGDNKASSWHVRGWFDIGSCIFSLMMSANYSFLREKIDVGQ